MEEQSDEHKNIDDSYRFESLLDVYYLVFVEGLIITCLIRHLFFDLIQVLNLNVGNIFIFILEGIWMSKLVFLGT